MKQAIALIFALLAALQAGDPLACSAARLAVLSLDCLGIPPAACQAAAVLPPRGQDQALVLLNTRDGQARCFAANAKQGRRRLRLSPLRAGLSGTQRWIPVSKMRLLTGVLLYRARI